MGTEKEGGQLGAFDPLEDFYSIQLRPSQPNCQLTRPVFVRCGQAFNPGSEEEFSKKSFEVKHITTFWSHSWRGPRWPKALTLMVIYNGQIAVCMGTLAAFLMMILFSFQLLPGFSRLTWDVPRNFNRF